jgi:hypothetical protein
MNKQQHKIHLNSHIENVGSTLLEFEDNRSNSLRRKTFRYAELEHNTDFNDNFRELVATLAAKNGVNSDTVWGRYAKFFELHSLYCGRFGSGGRSQLLRPMWKAFVDFEKGGEKASFHSLMFKEDIYSPSYYVPLFKQLSGE